MGAEYVILLGCVSGEYGFPSEIKDEKLLEILTDTKDTKTHEGKKLEEERRLFYVGLTRCKKELYIFSSNKRKSSFVSELQNSHVSFN